MGSQSNIDDLFYLFPDQMLKRVIDITLLKSIHTLWIFSDEISSVKTLLQYVNKFVDSIDTMVIACKAQYMFLNDLDV